MGETPKSSLEKITLSPIQHWLCNSKADELFAGSSRGPGKTFALCLRERLRIQYWKNYRSLFFRRNLTEIKDTLIDQFRKADALLGGGAKIVEGQEPRIVWPSNGSRITLSAAERPTHVDRHQGANFQTVVVDEAQNIQPDVLGRMSAIARSTVDEVKPQFVYLANPTGPGHGWLKTKFVTPAKEIAPHGNVVHDKDVWINPLTKKKVKLEDHWKFEDIHGNTLETILCNTDSNPKLDAEKYHKRMSANLSSIMKRAWVANDWDVMAGQFFPEISIWSRDMVPINAGDRIVIAIDPGRKCGVVWLAFDSEGRAKVFDSELFMNMTADTVAPAILERHPSLCNGATYVMDPAAKAKTHNASQSVHSVYRDFGINAVTKPSDRINGWEIIRTYGNADKLWIDYNQASLLISSLSGLVTKENEPKDCEKWHGSEEGLDGDHLADALRYGLSYVKFTGFEGQSVHNQAIDIRNNEFLSGFFE